MSTILVVDDDKTFSGLLKTVFELEGYRTILESHLDQVVPLAREEKPALILMDVHVGRRDTFDILREIRSDDDLENVPVIMTSGMDHSADCLEAGAKAFIMKPFRPSELLSKVREVIQT